MTTPTMKHAKNNAANLIIAANLNDAGISIDVADIDTLRRAAERLSRWHERQENEFIFQKVGSDDWYSQNHDTFAVKRIPDWESGPLGRITDVCEKYRLWWYINKDHTLQQGVLFLSLETPLSSRNYEEGILVK